MKMPCGKYAGQEMSEIADDYLEWVAREWEDDEIREAAEEELQIRWDKNPLKNRLRH